MASACLPFTLTRHRQGLALVGLMLATVALLAVNVAAGYSLKTLYLDMTEEKLLTLSESTKRVLSTVREPIIVRLYFSRSIGEKSPILESYYNYIKGLLRQYVDISEGLLKLESIYPEPFSEEEDQAVAFGLQGVPVSASGELGYFGLAATNSVDSQEIVSFFNPEREPFLEYDLTRIVHSLAMIRRKTIGILSTLPLDYHGGLESVLQPKEDTQWVLIKQIHALFNVQHLPTHLDSLPHDEIDVLMIVQPKNLPEKTLYLIDQFVLKGGRVLLFIDPVAENSHTDAATDFTGFIRLLNAWGIRFFPDNVAANIDAARRVNISGHGMHASITDHVAWLSLRQDAFDEGDAVVGTLERVNVATAGVLEAIDGEKTTIHTLISTSLRSMRLSAQQFTSPLPDVIGLVRAFRSENQRLSLAVRVTGIASSAFGDGPPAAWCDKSDHCQKAQQNMNVLLVADTDILTDSLWVQKQHFFGQDLIVPVADNGTFVLNALEDLSGAEALIGLRGRGRLERPFVLIETLRREAELRYRARERALLQQIDAVQERVRALGRRANKSSDILLMPQERRDLEHFRRDLLMARHELRAVKHALAQDIERLEGWIKILNIAGVPLVLTCGAVAVAVRRRRLRLSIRT